MLIVLLCALILDYFFAAPQKYHPLAGFANLAQRLELRFNDTHVVHSREEKRTHGLVAVLVFLLPAWWLTDLLVTDNVFGFIVEVIIVYLALDLSSIKSEAHKMMGSLRNKQSEQSREALNDFIDNALGNMDSQSAARVATENVLKNSNDSVFSVIFWFLVAGAPGVVVYKLCLILSQLWDVKNEHFMDFGYVAAKLEIILNFVPARLTALTYALMGNWQNATRCSSSQGMFWESNNAGVVLAAGAGALDVQLGGDVQTDEDCQQRPDLGCGKAAEPESINLACQLISRSVLLWLVIITTVSLVSWL